MRRAVSRAGRGAGGGDGSGSGGERGSAAWPDSAAERAAFTFALVGRRSRCADAGSVERELGVVADAARGVSSTACARTFPRVDAVVPSAASFTDAAGFTAAAYSTVATYFEFVALSATLAALGERRFRRRVVHERRDGAGRDDERQADRVGLSAGGRPRRGTECRPECRIRRGNEHGNECGIKRGIEAGTADRANRSVEFTWVEFTRDELTCDELSRVEFACGRS